MRIYVACLAAYNAGHLHGDWIDVSDDPAEMGEAVAAMLKRSPVPGAEEYAIHDYDGFPNMGEFPGLEAVAKTAELVELATDHGLDVSDFRRVAENWHGDAGDIRDAFGRWVGRFDCFRDYADELADSFLVELSGPAKEFANQYFDFEAHAQDVAHGCTVIELSDGVAVFYD